jgi:beta-carotene hydroxylase
MVGVTAARHAVHTHFAALASGTYHGSKPMRLRFREDLRTLFWAFVLFPAVPVLAYARPSLLPWLVPFALYFSYCSGVLTHNHNHSPVFRGRRANVAYGAWLSLFYGCPIFTWIPTHNQNHHRFNNAEGDATRTTRLSPENRLTYALIYPLASSSWQLPSIRAYVVNAWRSHPARFRRILAELSVLVIGHAALLGLALWWHGLMLGALVYGVSLGVPALLATYFMMFTNYLQHVDCDPASLDNHSRNFVSPFFNWFVFENGLHTVHHEHQGVHWSRYRALHEARAARIDPHLNQNSLFGYVASEYLLRLLRRPRGEKRPTASAAE